MAYTIHDFTQELNLIAIERFKDKEFTEDLIDRNSIRYKNLQSIFGDNTEMIDELYLKCRDCNN